MKIFRTGIVLGIAAFLISATLTIGQPINPGGGGSGGAITAASGSIATGAIVDDGAPGATACASDTASCNRNQQLQRIAQNLSTLITAVNSAIAAGANLIGFTTPDPCSQVVKVNFPISQTASTQIISGTSAKKTYICSIALVSGPGEIVNIIAGTGSVCATGSSVVAGSSTVGNGMSFGANGGLAFGGGLGTIAAATGTAADNVCLTQSGSNRVAGVITAVQQ